MGTGANKPDRYLRLKPAIYKSFKCWPVQAKIDKPNGVLSEDTKKQDLHQASTISKKRKNRMNMLKITVLPTMCQMIVELGI